MCLRLCPGRSKYPFRSGFPAENGVFHRKIIPPDIAPGGVDTAGLQVIDQRVKALLTMFVEHDISEFDIDHVTRQDPSNDWPIS